MKKLAFVLVALIALASLTIAAGCGQAALSGPDAISQAMGNLQNAGTMKADFNLQINVDGYAPQADLTITRLLPLSLTFTGKEEQDLSDPANPQLMLENLHVDGLDAIIQPVQGQPQTQQQRADVVNRALEAIKLELIDNSFYVRQGNQWYQLDLKNSPGAVDVGCAMAALPGGSSAVGLSADSLTDVQNVGTEDIDGTSTTHYSAGVDAAKLASESGALGSILSKCASPAATGTTTTAGTTTTPSAGELARVLGAVFNNMKLDFWIDSDGNIRQLHTSLAMKLGDVLSLTGTSSLTADQQQLIQGLSPLDLNVDMTVKPSDLGQQVYIDTPDPNQVAPFDQLTQQAGAAASALG